MLIDKAREFERDVKKQREGSDPGYVAGDLWQSEVLEMAQALIAVDDVLKKIENERQTEMCNQFTVVKESVAEEIRKAIEG